MAKECVAYAGPIVNRSQAKVSPARFYFTGKPCKNGHINQRFVKDGCCIDCRRSYKTDPEKLRASAAKPERRAKKSAYGRAMREHIKAVTDPEILRAKWREDYKKNPQAGVARSLKWQASNQDAMVQYRIRTADVAKARSARWKKENAEKARASVRKYQLANPENGKNWKKANPEKVKAIKQNRRARERNAEGRHTADELKALFEKQNGHCVYCSVSLADGYDADHIKPLSKGGSNWISNIQLLCESCNSRKWAIDPVEFARRIKLKAA